MKTYAVRKKLRTPVHCQFYCVTDDMLIDGIVWDLSETGSRVTVERPIPVGLEKPIFITLQEGKDYHHLLVHSAIVRWTDGCEAGWEFLQIDELGHTRLTDFLEQSERDASGSLNGCISLVQPIGQKENNFCWDFRLAEVFFN